jgi:hypothetical protein
VTIPRKILKDAIRIMRNCGEGQRECVVFVVEHVPTGVLNVIHPVHSARGGGYEIEQQWLGQFSARQTREAMEVVAQIHTHPGSAFHSSTDDAWPMVGTAGFVSVVVPEFALGRISIDEVYACRLTTTGTWEELDTSEVFAQ